MKNRSKSVSLGLRIGAGLIVGLVIAWAISSDSALARLDWSALVLLFISAVLISLWQMVLIWQWSWRKRFVRRWALVLPLAWIGVLVGVWLVDAEHFGALVMWIVVLPLMITLGAGWAIRRERRSTPAAPDSPEQPEARLQALLDVLEAQPDAAPQQVMTNHYNAGVMLNNLGRFAEMIPHMERARALAAETGNASLEAHAVNYIGLAQLELAPQAATDTFQQALTLFEGVNRQRSRLERLLGLNDQRTFEAMVLCNLSVTHLKLDQPDAALQRVDEATAVYAASGITGGIFAENLRVQKSRALHALGRDAEARALIAQTQQALAQAAGMNPQEQEILQGWIDATRAELGDAS